MMMRILMMEFKVIKNFNSSKKGVIYNDIINKRNALKSTT
ncbi:hypothetical protein CNEO4_140005 [Clostridium neonatale]|nr:hypothetical protein CNEO4_130135 [Clostridium neonatale]CAI3597543.1 hypothetical protein CNEO4_140005 [Clostridium neonatale]CAI3608347.1 hypothetical protein CNEO4_130023 [Clostridium neonatale]CAI4138775.1 hypothetical protein CNEO4_140022 [Clostridium neonatale]